MTTFTTGGSAVTFTTSGSAVSFAVTDATNAFTTSAVLTPGAHASTHGAGGADPITTLGTVTTTLGTVTTLASTNASIATATITTGTVTTLSATNTATFGSAVSIALGGAASPTLRFTGDTNTGIYSPGADQVGIATAGTARVAVSPTGAVAIGNTSTVAGPSSSGNVQVIGTDAASAGFSVHRFSNGATGPVLQLNKSRGATIGAAGAVTSGDVLGYIRWGGDDGTNQQLAGELRSEVDGTVSAGTVPSRMTIYTTSTAGASTERMRIDNAGLITGTGTSLGAWTSYTPTLGGTGWAIGDGTAAGYYCQIGKVVHFFLVITFGSTSTFGGTQLTLSLPVTARFATSQLGQGVAIDTSLSATYTLTNRGTSTSVMTPRLAGSGTTAEVGGLTTTSPFAWASTDVIRLAGTYEIA